MLTYRQLIVHIAVFLAFFVTTIAILQWRHTEPPRQRMLLNQSTMVQIEVPIGLLPAPTLEPAFGMEDGRVAWIDEAAADDLATIFTGAPPAAWPDPQPPATAVLALRHRASWQ